MDWDLALLEELQVTTDMGCLTSGRMTRSRYELEPCWPFARLKQPQRWMSFKGHVLLNSHDGNRM
jgi:hypothetical protein